MKLSEIVTSLEKIKRDINGAFEKGQIDFDRIESAIASIISSIEKRQKSANHGATVPILDCELYK